MLKPLKCVFSLCVLDKIYFTLVGQPRSVDSLATSIYRNHLVNIFLSLSVMFVLI